VQGVYRTRVGYCGGIEEFPTYKNIKDYTESFEFDYDGDLIDYESIINTFWYSHTPENRSGKTQYKSIIFYRNEDERKIAVESKKEFERISGRSFSTEIRAISKFYLAENYHQKFFLQNVEPLRQDFISIYPNFMDFINSTAAMRVNSYCKGNGTFEGLMKEINDFQLSPRGISALKSVVEGYGR
jgi:peptide-methionine (S)-S-oxide reductase